MVNELEIKKYWDCLDESLEQLIIDGYCFLPSIKSVIDINFLSDQILDDISDKVGTSNLESHINFCKEFGITDILAPKLYNLAKTNLIIMVQFLINIILLEKLIQVFHLRHTGHFDSHCFTLVMPVTIPSKIDESSLGELIFFPNIRKFPSNEIANFFGKLFYKKYASKNGFNDLYQKKNSIKADFQDYKPLLFIGNTTLHGNLPVAQIVNSHRLTLLSHFFDPSPSWGIGNILRKVRNR